MTQRNSKETFRMQRSQITAMFACFLIAVTLSAGASGSPAPGRDLPPELTTTDRMPRRTGRSLDLR
jgi:hypothetical protein